MIERVLVFIKIIKFSQWLLFEIDQVFIQTIQNNLHSLCYHLMFLLTLFDLRFFRPLHIFLFEAFYCILPLQFQVLISTSLYDFLFLFIFIYDLVCKFSFYVIKIVNFHVVYLPLEVVFIHTVVQL